MALLKTTLMLSLKDSISSGLPKVNQKIDSLNNHVNRLSSSFVGLASAIGGGMALSNSIKFNDSMTRIGIQAHISDNAISKLKSTMFNVGVSTGISADSIKDSFSQIMDSTGDLKFANANLKNMGISMQATGASGKDIGSLYTEFDKLGLSSKQAFSAFDILNIQGKKGSITLKDMAGQASKMIPLYQAMTNRKGLNVVKESGALIQVFRQVTGSADEATTVFQGYVNAIGSGAIQKKLKHLGIAVKDSSGNMRSGVDILKDVVAKSKGNMTAIQTIFTDSTSQKAFLKMVSEYKKTGKFKTLDNYANTKGDGLETLKDYKRANGTMLSQLGRLKTAFTKLMDVTLTPILKYSADAIELLGSNNLESAINKFKYVLWGLAGTFVALKTFVIAKAGINKANSVINLFKRNSNNGNGGLSNPLLKDQVQKVYVLNMPRNGFGGGGGSDDTATGYDNSPQGKANRRARAKERLKARTRRNSRLGRISGRIGGRRLKIAGGGLGGAIAGIGLNLAVNHFANADTNTDTGESKKEQHEELGETIGSTAGATIGGAIGASLGSVIPVAGTIIGGMIGSALGGWLGGKGGKGVVDIFSSTPQSSQQPVQPYNITHTFQHNHTHNYNGISMNTTTATTHVRSSPYYAMGSNQSSY